MKLTLEQLKQNVKTWSEQRLILEQSTCAKQIEKFYSERAEMFTTDDLEDSLGDQMVCLINAELMQGDGSIFLNIKSNSYIFEHLSEIEKLISIGNIDDAIYILNDYISIEFDVEKIYGSVWSIISKRAGLMIDGKFEKWDNLTHSQRVQVAKLGQLSHKEIDIQHCKSFCDDAQWLEIMNSIK